MKFQHVASTHHLKITGGVNKCDGLADACTSQKKNAQPTQKLGA